MKLPKKLWFTSNLWINRTALFVIKVAIALIEFCKSSGKGMLSNSTGRLFLKRVSPGTDTTIHVNENQPESTLCSPSMVMQPLQELQHQLRTTVLLAEVRKIIEDRKVLLEDILVSLLREVDVDS